MSNRAITIAELAEQLAVSVHGALALVSSGTIKAFDVRRPGSSKPRWRISPAALADFQAARSNKSSPKAAPRRRTKSPEGVINFF